MVENNFEHLLPRLPEAAPAESLHGQVFQPSFNNSLQLALEQTANTAFAHLPQLSFLNFQEDAFARSSEGEKKDEVVGRSDKRTVDAPRPLFNAKEITVTDAKNLFGGLSLEKIDALKAELTKIGRDPKDAIMDAVKNNRVVGLGETHSAVNGLREDGRALIPEFVKNGVTHMAVEIDKSLQPKLDEFLAGKITREEFKESFSPGSAKIDTQDSWFDMLKEAHKAGLKIVAVDDVPPEAKTKPNAELNDDVRDHRDKKMAENVSAILKSDAKAKAVFWVGSDHLGTGKSKTAGQLLKDEWGSKGGVATFGSRLEQGPPNAEIEKLLPGMQRSVAIDMSKAKEVMQPKSVAYDQVLLYPAKHVLKQMEEKLGADSKELIPVLQNMSLDLSQGLNKTEAMALQERAIKLTAKHFGQESPQMVQALDSLATMQEMAGKPNESLETLRKALTIGEVLKGDKGMTTEVAGRLGEALRKRGKTDEALEIVLKQMSSTLSDKKLFLSDTMRAASLGGGGLIELAERLRSAFLNSSDKTAKSQKLLEAWVALEKKHDTRSEYGIENTMHLARIYEKTGQKQKADEMSKEALLIAEKSADKHQLQTALSFRTQFLTREGRHQEAQPLLEQNVKMLTDAKAANREIIAAQTKVAENLLAQGKNNEAERVFRAAIKLAGHKVEDAGTAINSYVKFLSKEGRKDEAAKFKSLLRK